MRWLLFLSRLAFISGFCILLSILFLIFPNLVKEDHVVRTVIVIGFFIGAAVIPITNLCYLGVLIVKRKIPVPFWLVISNLFFLVAILFFIILGIKKEGDPNDIHVP